VPEREARRMSFVVATDRPHLRRDYPRSLRAALRWLRDPVSEGGVEAAFEMVFGLAGPTVQREFERFAADPVGRRLLEERPNLVEALSEMESLAALPAGSFGRAYHEFMSDVGMAGAEEIPALGRIDELARRFGWSEEIAWFVGRMAGTHDVFHVLSGYGRDFAGEGANIAFTAGQFQLAPLWIQIAYANPWCGAAASSYRCRGTKRSQRSNVACCRSSPSTATTRSRSISATPTSTICP